MKWLATAHRWLLTRHLPAKNLARRSPNSLARSTPRIGRALAQRQLKEHPDAITSGRKDCEKDDARTSRPCPRPKSLAGSTPQSFQTGSKKISWCGLQEWNVAKVVIRTVQKRTVLALLVEANGLVRLEINRALAEEHFEVLWTATTQEAVAAYNRRHIDLLLLDLNQPLKVGWDVFEPVGALNPALPVVMVMEKKTELEQTVAERVGARLEKPFSLRALIQTIRLLLDRPTQVYLQATGSESISKHSASSQPAPRWSARQETARKQTYETGSAPGGRRP